MFCHHECHQGALHAHRIDAGDIMNFSLFTHLYTFYVSKPHLEMFDDAVFDWAPGPTMTFTCT